MSTKRGYSQLIFLIIFIFSMSSASYAASTGNNKIEQLALAIRDSNVQMVKDLLKKGATLTTTGVTTFHWAVRSGNKEITEIIFNHSNDKNLLNAKDKIVYKKDLAGRTPLHYAVSPDCLYNKEVVEYLINQGAELYPTLLHDVVNSIDDCESIIDEILKHKSDREREESCSSAYRHFIGYWDRLRY